MTVPSLLRSATLCFALLALQAGKAAPASQQWEQCGWGGGGYYYAAAYHPTKDGVIYLAGDVGGIYKSVDHGKNFRMINQGLEHYGVFTLAVDRQNPATVYAATEGGLYKSTDEGEHWSFLPHTGPKELHLTGEKKRSVHSVAVNPADGRIVYAGSPVGKIYKSEDGGQSWKISYEPKDEAETADKVRVQFGKVDAQYFGGLWLPLAFPATAKAEDCVGLGFSWKGDKSQPKELYLTLKTSTVTFRSRNLNALFASDQNQEVLLKAEDFAVDPEYAKKNPDAANAKVDWATVNRVDLAMSGGLPTAASVAQLGPIAFVSKSAAKSVVADVAAIAGARTYGNIRVGAGAAAGASVYSIVVTPQEPALVLAATESAGLVLSQDAGAHWRPLAGGKKAMAAAFDPTNPQIIYGGFSEEGLSKSTDGGRRGAVSERRP